MRMSAAIDAFARALAFAGGLCLCALIILTVVSVAGRALIGFGLKPVPGDFELVEGGMSFAVFSFLPWCHLRRGNVSVEVFTAGLGAGANRFIDAVSDSLMLAFAVLLAWRHFLGVLDKKAYGETTFILQFPIWWAYAAGMVGAAGLVIVALYCFGRSWAALISGTPAAGSEGNGH